MELKDIDYLITDWNTQTKEVIALRSLGAVSYTHLDVDKRQIQRRSR